MKEITLMKPTTEAVKKFNDLLKDQHKADTIRKMRVAHEKPLRASGTGVISLSRTKLQGCMASRT